MTCDLISLILQAAGGAVTSIADEQSLQDTGVNIMIAGLVFQVASIIVFCILVIEYGVRVVRGKRATSEKRQVSWRRRSFLLGMHIATHTATRRTLLIKHLYQAWRLQF